MKTPPLEELVANLSPVSIAAPRRPTLKYTPADCTIVAGDFHFGMHDEGCEDIFLQVVADLRPRRIVLNGDLPDMLMLSRYPKDIKDRWSLLYERTEMLRFLRRLHDLTADWPCELFETNANHSGASAASRWRRFMSERLGELASFEPFLELIEYERSWHPPAEWNRLELVDQVELTPELVVLHGTKVRSKGGYSARAHLDALHVSLIHNHTHRFGLSPMRVPGLGIRTDRVYRSYENGCMCRLDPPYGDGHPDWHQGFSIVRHDEEGRFGVEQVHIDRGAAVVASLGGTYRASR